MSASPDVSTRRDSFSRVYWCFPVALILVQLAFTLSSTVQIRHEELGASTCNVYWLEHRTVYDGTSTNIGWYGLLMLVYRVAGYSLFYAKVVRLGIHAISVFCLASLLRRWLGPQRAALPLLVAGLSPSLLYFNTMQAEFGLDLQYAPICLFLLLRSGKSLRPVTLLLHACFGCMLMVACLSYPAFLITAPGLLLVYVHRLYKHHRTDKKHIPAALGLAAGTGFVLPLLAGVLYLKAPGLLLYDPQTGGGLFRGGGRFAFSLRGWWDALNRTLSDLLVQGNSYYFELPEADIAGLTGAVPAVFVMIAAAYLLFRDVEYRFPLLVVLLVAVLGVLLPGLDPRLPGLRRATGLLVALYAAYAVVWARASSRGFGGPRFDILAVTFCCLLLLHHLLAVAPNLVSLQRPSRFRDTTWFAVEDTPLKSLDYWLQHTASGYALAARDRKTGELTQRPYSEIFSALAGYRLWNGLEPIPIGGYDQKKRRPIELHVRLWEEYYFDH